MCEEFAGFEIQEFEEGFRLKEGLAESIVVTENLLFNATAVDITIDGEVAAVRPFFKLLEISSDGIREAI